MARHDDLRFLAFTRDLARRQRRPRLYPAPPAPTDVLEQLCGAGPAAAAPMTLTFPPLPDERSASDLEAEIADLPG
jgi:hypothetical protein